MRFIAAVLAISFLFTIHPVFAANPNESGSFYLLENRDGKIVRVLRLRDRQRLLPRQVQDRAFGVQYVPAKKKNGAKATLKVVRTLDLKDQQLVQQQALIAQATTPTLAISPSNNPIELTPGSYVVSAIVSGTTSRIRVSVAQPERAAVMEQPASNYPALIIDNANLEMTNRGGRWKSSTWFPGYYGNDYLHNENSADRKYFGFNPRLGESGMYRVSLRWTTGANRATNVPVVVRHSRGETTVLVNQRDASTNATWNVIGDFHFSPQNQPGITISAGAGTDGHVIVDAAMFQLITSDPCCTQPTPQTPPDIKNPYFQQPAWRLWTENPAPVTLSTALGPKTFSPPPASVRRYPDSATVQMPYSLTNDFLRLTSVQGVMSGFWDDASASMDYGHSSLGWTIGIPNRIDLTGQFMRTVETSLTWEERMELGANFTSESYSYMGHHLTSNRSRSFDTEKFFLFSDTIRGAPAFYSYRDMAPDKIVDSFDGIFPYMYHSLGRSGSEVRGLQKMLVAGGYLPRKTKDLLKKNGAYSSALLYIFKASLPYSNSTGAPVAYENELRHRPAYLSNGYGTDREHMAVNVPYHRYDERLHLYNMVQLAASMSVPPPVTVLKLIDFSVISGGKAIVSSQQTDSARRWLKDIKKTAFRVWGGSDETIILRIDTGESYDLLGAPLTFKVKALYPEQKNLWIEREGTSSIYRITVSYSSDLPKGRIPVIIVANNGVYDSNPAFINFYWPAPEQVETPDYVGVDAQRTYNPERQVNDNLRPQLTVSPVSTTVAAGEKLAATVRCSDPEGFPTRLFQWGDVGTIVNGQFLLQTSLAQKGRTLSANIICSDGTGAYSGREIAINVE